MFRRNFMKVAIASIGALFVPKVKAGAKIADTDPRKLDPPARQVPPLPTLEWLQEHNKDVIAFYATYITSQGYGPDWTAEVYCRKDKARDGSRGTNYRADLVFRDGKWRAEDRRAWANSATYAYTKKGEWPDWLRKF